MQIRRVSGALGAEITGVDLRDPEFDFDAVYRAFLEHEVIFFRGLTSPPTSTFVSVGVSERPASFPSLECWVPLSPP